MRSAQLLIALCLAVGLVDCWNLKPRRGYAARPKAGPVGDGDTFVVLVAGSNGWYNYRHQADVAHAYQTLRYHGIPADNIITMMYDDVANNGINPYKGKLFNRPHGKDVYKGIKIDYKGPFVTPDNFLNVLKGNSSGIIGGGRVLQTTSEDRIFVYFTDHGGVGLISFPEDMLTVKQLNEALTWMHKNEKFSQLVFYLEACESGSMFDSVLRDDINVYAITAANGHESSWGTYCENDMHLPCLGDLFSVNWITDSDEEDLSRETLQYQYELVKRMTNLSHVMHYGDLSIASEVVGLFQGDKPTEDIDFVVRHIPRDSKKNKAVSWPSRDVELNQLKYMHRISNNLFEQKNIAEQVHKIKEDRKSIKELVHDVVDDLLESPSEKRRMFENRRPVLDVNCHHLVTNAFDKYCVDFNKHDYAMKYANVLNNLCIELGANAILPRLPVVCRGRFDNDDDEYDDDDE